MTLFPVHRLGGLIGAEWVIFFRCRDFSPFFLSIFLVFYYTNKNSKKKKKDFPASRLAFILATRWIGNKLFFKGDLGSWPKASENCVGPVEI